MMTSHLVAIAATILGTTGTLSITACRTALRCIDVDVVPRHLMPRVRWWRSHCGGAALHASLTVLVLGLVGLLIS